jgi:DNA-binding transcriptional LysR family regulator
VELYQLKTFVAVAQEGNLSRAAERLFLSQPAVSAQIKALEEELGLALFLRTPRGMEPTPAGLQLRERAEATLKSAEDFLHQAQAVSGRLSGPFRLGHNTDPEYLRIFRVAQEVHQEHPGIELELFKANSGEIRPDLETGRLDAGYIYGPSPHPSVQVELLTLPRLVLTLPAAWSEECCTLPLAEVAAQGWLWTPPTCPFHQTIAAFLEDCGVVPNRVLAVDDEDMIATLLRANKGASFLREDRALDMVSRGEARIWQGRSLTIPVHLAYLARRAGDPLIRAVRACVRRAWDLPAEPR